MAISQVAQAHQVNRTTLHRWRARFLQLDGVQGLPRFSGSGCPRKLHPVTPERLRQIVLQPAASFGFETDFWTAKRLHQVIIDQFAGDVTVRTILRCHQEAGLTYQKPIDLSLPSVQLDLTLSPFLLPATTTRP